MMGHLIEIVESLLNFCRYFFIYADEFSMTMVIFFPIIKMLGYTLEFLINSFGHEKESFHH